MVGWLLHHRFVALSGSFGEWNDTANVHRMGTVQARAIMPKTSSPMVLRMEFSWRLFIGGPALGGNKVDNRENQKDDNQNHAHCAGSSNIHIAEECLP